MPEDDRYPDAIDPDKVGEYAALSKSGGGFVWDAVLEYRVWCCPANGAADEEDGSDYFFAFATYSEALDFSQEREGADKPIVLILQSEFIDQPEPGQYEHVREERITEWPVEFLSRPKRDAFTIPDFMSPSAPANRLDILRGIAPRPHRPAQGKG